VKNARREQKCSSTGPRAGAQNERIEELLVRLNAALEQDEKA
jgi:hypothetical protein